MGTVALLDLKWEFGLGLGALEQNDDQHVEGYCMGSRLDAYRRRPEGQPGLDRHRLRWDGYRARG